MITNIGFDKNGDDLQIIIEKFLIDFYYENIKIENKN